MRENIRQVSSRKLNQRVEKVGVETLVKPLRKRFKIEALFLRNPVHPKEYFSKIVTLKIGFHHNEPLDELGGFEWTTFYFDSKLETSLAALSKMGKIGIAMFSTSTQDVIRC